MPGEQVDDTRFGLQTARRKPLREPGRELLGVKRPDDHVRAGGFHGLHPMALALGLVELAGYHQQHYVGRDIFRQLGQQRRTGLARPAGRQVQLDETTFGEQGQRLGGGAQAVPIETGPCREHAAFIAARIFGATANGLTAFIDLQRFIAAHQIERGQPTLQLARQLIGVNLHCRRPCSRN